MAETLRARILDDLTAAMKAGDKERVGVLRLLKSEIQREEVDLRASKGAGYALTDDEVLAVLTRAAKQRRESIESFRGGGRDDLADKEAAELEVIRGYLPEQLDRNALESLVAEAIAESGAAGPRDMGKVMKVLMPKVRGRADGKLVNEIVKAKLGG